MRHDSMYDTRYVGYYNTQGTRHMRHKRTQGNGTWIGKQVRYEACRAGEHIGYKARWRVRRARGT